LAICAACQALLPLIKPTILTIAHTKSPGEDERDAKNESKHIATIPANNRLSVQSNFMILFSHIKKGA
jgi:hypothetical protein